MAKMVGFGVHELNNMHQVTKKNLKNIWKPAKKQKTPRELIVGQKPQPNRKARGGG